MKVSTAAALAIVATLLHAAGVPAQHSDPVWVWNDQCPSPTKMALVVTLDGKAIYKTSLFVCRWDRQSEKGVASFQFISPRPLVWSGYRSDRDVTPKGARLTMDFWQAGGESDSITLGYSVAAADGLHMNALHFLAPTGTRRSQPSSGLVVETRPAVVR
jgi:hypothetical protein